MTQDAVVPQLTGLMRVAVVQPLPGIGDMIWHLPHIRAIATRVGRPISLLAKPRSVADQLFSAESTVGEVIWYDRNPRHGRGQHDGLVGFGRLAGLIRSHHFDAVVVLHHSRLLAAAVLAAGVKRRLGYGYPGQRPFLNQPPFLPAAVQRLHPFEQATAWLAAAHIPLPEAEPRLSIASSARHAVAQRLGQPTGKVIALGIASSEPYKQWGAERFAALAGRLLDMDPQASVVLVGGSAEAPLAEDIRRRLAPRVAAVRVALGWNLTELAALFDLAGFYVGNDTGVMNLAAAVGTRSYGLFGGTEPFHHSSAISPILPPDGKADRVDGMARITVATVLAAIQDDHRGR